MVVRLHHSLHLAMVENPHLLRVRKSDYYYATRAHCSLVACHKILCTGRNSVLGSQPVLQSCLELVNVHVPRPWEAPNNDVLAACAARHGATIVDWHTNAVGLAPDGYHLGGLGTAAYATLIAAAVKQVS